jgi:hypothetical protein
MKPLTLALSLLACVILSVPARAAAKSPSTQPGVGVIAYAGSSTTQLQNALNLAAARAVPLVIDAGTYTVDRPLVVPPGRRVTSDGATLIGTAAGPILMVSGDGTRIEGLAFHGAVAGVTGISGEFVRARVRDCEFWTTLSYGVDGHGLLSRVTECRFGLAGDPPKQFQAVRIRSTNGSTNAWEIDHCALYNGAGECVVEVGDGYQLDFHHNNVERNRTRVAVKFAGMSCVHIHDNWFENNAGQSQVELVHDATNQIGNYVVSSHNNWWNLDGFGNQRAYLTFGACHVHFYDESGTNWSGKQVASEPGKVDVGQHWLVGYQE